MAFPSLLNDPPSKYLSIVVPAYKEELRITKMLQETFQYLTQKIQSDPSFTYEVIVVDDGSTDNTSQVALDFSRQYGSDIMRVLTLSKNLGKGGAIQSGMLCSRGQFLLMADADGATKISDLDSLISAIQAKQKDGLAVAVGSRAHLEEKAIATVSYISSDSSLSKDLEKRKWYRNITMHGFHLLVKLFSVRSIRDTQCGFKLFTRKAAQWIFYNQHLHGWAFDAELLYIAEQKRIPLIEVSVNWYEVAGSKLSIVSASISMARELVLIWISYSTGLWRINHPPPSR